MSLGAVYLKYRIKAHFLLEGYIVSEKRRDNKGRILKTGESQRKDLLYQYRYMDTAGKRKTIYAPDLKTLREKEERIEQTRRLGVDYFKGLIPLSNFLDRYLSTKRDVRASTWSSYKRQVKAIQEYPIATKNINQITILDAKQWITDLYNDGYAFGTIKNLKNFLKQAFDTAIEDNILIKNPFSFRVSFIPNNSTTKESLTDEQQQILKSYFKNRIFCYPWYDIIVVLLGTGLRAGEFCALTVDSLDFKNRTINVEWQLRKDENTKKIVLTRPKSKAGIRLIPMTQEVYNSLKNILSISKGSNAEVDGVSGFLVLDSSGMPCYAQLLSQAFRVVIRSYNKTHSKQPLNISLHTLRHTFCTNLISRGADVKMVQYLMGHASVDMTLDIYTHIDYPYIQNKMEEIFLHPKNEEDG